MSFIVWSDDCLSCLTGLPHSLEKHMRAVNDALEALRQDGEDLERSLLESCQDDYE